MAEWPCGRPRSVSTGGVSRAAAAIDRQLGMGPARRNWEGERPEPSAARTGGLARFCLSAAAWSGRAVVARVAGAVVREGPEACAAAAAAFACHTPPSRCEISATPFTIPVE